MNLGYIRRYRRLAIIVSIVLVMTVAIIVIVNLLNHPRSDYTVTPGDTAATSSSTSQSDTTDYGPSKNEVIIANYTDYQGRFVNQDKSLIQNQLYLAAARNTSTDTTKKIYIANIRDGSYKSPTSSTYSVIVDIPDLQQTFRIDFYSSSDRYVFYVMCPQPSESKYSNFSCTEIGH